MPASQPYNEQELLLRIAEGDEKAFADLVTKYAPKLYGYIFNLTRRADHAQDVVQEVFVDIWLARDSMLTVRNFNAFIMAVTRNKTISAMRSMIKERARQEEWIFTQNDIFDKEEDDERLSLIDEAITRLTPQQQKIWILTKREGKSYQEAADILNISRETVKKHLQYANASIFSFVSERLPLIIIAYIFTR